MKTMNTKIAKRIKDRMLAQSMRAVDVARKTGTTRATVSQWLRGENVPRYASMELLGEALDCDPYWLATGETLLEGQQQDRLIDKKAVSIRLRDRMRSFHLTIKELASLTYSSPTTVGQWLKGDSAPNLDKLELLSEALQCTKEWLLFGIGDEPEKPEQHQLSEPYPDLFHISDRIEHRIQYLGLRPIDLARAINVGKASVSQWLNGVSKPSGKFIPRLANALKCTTEWLLTGNNEARNPSNKFAISNSLPAWKDNAKTTNDEVVVPLLTDQELMTSKQRGEFNLDDVISGKAKVRELRFAKSTIDAMSVNPRSILCIKIDIPAMRPIFSPESTIGIDLARKEVKDGQLCAFWHFNTFRAATLFHRPDGGLRIRNLNEVEYPEEQIHQSDMAKIDIIGRIFWHSVFYRV